MTDTVVAAANRVKQWDAKHHKEYIRSNRFKRFMGTSENSIIQVKEDLTKKKGDSISITLVGALDKTSGPNDGTTNLVGNEKALPNDGYSMKVKVVRDATVVNVEEEQASPISIRQVGKVALKDLQMRYLRDDLITGFHSINGKTYGDASEADKDQWLASNSDRVLFGSAVSNNAGNDHSVSLANIDGTNDKLTGHVVSLIKRRAQKAKNANGDGIRPYRFGEDQETFVLFVGTEAFRDFRQWLTDTGNLKDAMERGKANPLFAGPTSYEWDGVIVREIPEIESLSGVGNGGIDVAPCFLCGAQALAVSWAMRTKTTLRKEDDYGFKHGVGFMELREVGKVLWNQETPASAKDWGMATLYVSAVEDA